jgi:methylaspartate mutase sigma subunit
MSSCVLVAGTASDSHTWNLVYLQLLAEEHGCEVVNLGACVPVELLVDACSRYRPDMVVLGTVNGHGHLDGLAAIRALRARPQFANLPVVIGGKLGVLGGQGNEAFTRQLLDAGFTAVFGADEPIERFEALLTAVTRGADGTRPAPAERHPDLIGAGRA